MVLDLLKRKPSNLTSQTACKEVFEDLDIGNDRVAKLLANQVLQGFAPSKNTTQINTGGGAVIEGAVTVQGDFAGRDLIQFISKASALTPNVAQQYHLTYLRSWFSQSWASVSLADYADGKYQPVSLLDIYVPLPLDFNLTLAVRDKKWLVDWWSDDEYETQMLAEQTAKTGANGLHDPQKRPKRRDWPSLGVGEKDIQRIVAGYAAKKNLEIATSKGDERSDAEAVSTFMEAQDAASVQPRFVLVGDPGTGKSSFMRYLTLCMAGQQLIEANSESKHARANVAALVDWLTASYTPLYIELRDLVKQSFAPLPSDPNQPALAPTLNDFWAYVQTQVLGVCQLDAYLPELFRRMNNGEVLLLLDGLDEVSDAADPRRRKQIQTLIKKLDQYNVRIIITSRSHAYRKGEWTIEGFGRAELRPLGHDRLRQLAQALFAQLGRENELKEFDAALENVPENLKTNPLFFTLLAAIWLRSSPPHSLPHTENELYARSVDLMLTRWVRRSAAGESVAGLLKLNETQLRQVLQGVALRVQGNSKPDADSTLFDDMLLVEMIRRMNKYAPDQAIIDYLEQKAGLLVSPAPESFRFAHRSFQEYLAACELVAPTLCLYKPAEQPALVFPNGLTRRLIEKPDLWLNVAQHAADLLQRRDAAALWQVLPALFDPYLNASTNPAHAQAALLALQLAQRHGLLTGQRKPYSAEAGILDGMVRVALKAIRDNTLPATQRAEAGRTLAKLGDPRREVMTVDAIELCDVPAGEFWMGAQKDHPQYPDDMASDSEGPLHRQYTAAFCIARYPITQAQYAEFVAATNDPANKPYQDDNDVYQLPNHPVVGVSWRQAVAFTEWLTERWRRNKKISNQQVVRLPTEAEWEKAARGLADARRYPWGPDPNPNAANYNDSGIGSTSAVGCFSLGKTPFGCEEMSGNVREWTLTKWLRDYQDYAQKVDISLQGEDERVVRGGAFSYNQRGARCAYCLWNRPVDLSLHLGFRVVVSPAS